MPDDPKPPAPSGDEDHERQVRSTRKFSLNEAIGRLAGGDFMKGGTPVTRKQQAELALDDYLRSHLIDKGGVLRTVLLRRVDEPLLRADYARPLAVLAQYLTGVLASEDALTEVVREADVDWGRALGERPHFDKPGAAADPDDPYTVESVRASLTRLAAALEAAKK